MTIRREGDKSVLRSKTGKVLGKHETRAGAERQERKIQIAKARKAGHRIPKK